MNRFMRFRYFFLGILLLCIVGLEMRMLAMDREESSVYQERVDEFVYYTELIEKIQKDLKCFPVIKEEGEGYPVTYENTWGAERTYGGERTHEGCDLMAAENERGRYKICSMTDGTVKNIGWLEQGGWRIGIESEDGIYYYYAHLDSYERAFEKGDPVAAGEVLGRMGDSGYGKEPGTKGHFDVHLHVGIYVKDLQGNERALNPYWYLKRLEI